MDNVKQAGSFSESSDEDFPVNPPTKKPENPIDSSSDDEGPRDICRIVDDSDDEDKDKVGGSKRNLNHDEKISRFFISYNSSL